MKQVSDDIHRPVSRLCLRAALVVAGLLGAWRAPASTLVINVNSAVDAYDGAPLDFTCETAPGNGICTLRAALEVANYYSYTFAAATVVNIPAGHYVLTNGALVVDYNVSLVGAGAGVTTIDANQISRVFAMNGTAPVSLSGLTITGGRPADALGGGVYNHESPLTITRCVIQDNHVTARYSGGGVFSGPGFLTVVDSVIRNNAAPGGNGGGLYAEGNTVIVRSTVSENTAGQGAGIQQEVGSLKIVNSTISSNDAENSGGGLFLQDVVGATLNNVTVVGNGADSSLSGGASGGGMSFISASVTLSNSIFANLNDASHENDDLDSCGTLSTAVTSNGFNIIRAPGACAVSGAFTAVDLQVGNLADNGGLTKTNALLPGSPPVNTGSTAGCTDAAAVPLTTDQRGVKRTIGARCDLGAFELEPIGDANGDGTVSVADVFYLVNFLFAGGPLPLGRSNANGDSAVNVSDVFYLIDYLFSGGPVPVSL